MTLIWIVGIATSVIGTAIYAIFSDGFKSWFGQQIRITHPAPGGTLTNPEPLGPGQCFPVRGTLKRLPKGHEVWLLTQNETTGKLSPQGFFLPKYDPLTETWMGKVTEYPKSNIRIIAVVAPSTSQDLFRYYQHVGRLNGHKFEPLTRVPPECRNIASVQAVIP